MRIEGDRIVFDTWGDYVGTVDAAKVEYHHTVRRGRNTPRKLREFVGVDSISEALALAQDGWGDELAPTLSAADAVLLHIEAEHTLAAFIPTFDVTGTDIDMGRYLGGEPECMIDYPLTEIVAAGRVITICASMTTSGAVSPRAIIGRGRVIVALAIALERAGYGVEVIADSTVRDAGRKPYRVCVKSAHDSVDPERLMFALAHPAAQRVISFGVDYGLGVKQVGDGQPSNPARDMVDGTLYFDRMSTHDRPAETFEDIADEVLTHLRTLGIVTD